MGNFYIVLVALPRATAVYRSCLTWICWVGIISNANMILKKVCLSKNKLNLLFNYCICAGYLGRVVLLVCTKVPGHQSPRGAVLPSSIDSTIRSVTRHPYNKKYFASVYKYSQFGPLNQTRSGAVNNAVYLEINRKWRWSRSRSDVFIRVYTFVYCNCHPVRICSSCAKSLHPESQFRTW